MSDEYNVDVQVTAPVAPTEVRQRVAEAISAVFPDADPQYANGELVGRTGDLSHFSDLVHRRSILDTARSVLFGGREGRTIAFDLKKQAAYEGRVTFAVGDPAELGDIHVRIRVDAPDVEGFVDLVAPPTEDGVPVDPEDA